VGPTGVGGGPLAPLPGLPRRLLLGSGPATSRAGAAVPRSKARPFAPKHSPKPTACVAGRSLQWPVSAFAGAGFGPGSGRFAAPLPHLDGFRPPERRAPADLLRLRPGALFPRPVLQRSTCWRRFPRAAALARRRRGLPACANLGFRNRRIK